MVVAIVPGGPASPANLGFAHEGRSGRQTAQVHPAADRFEFRFYDNGLAERWRARLDPHALRPKNAAVKPSLH